ncbi:hypothetical protein GCM10029992_11100 [Glycomyces albus]
MPEQEGEVVDFTDEAQASTFGQNADGGYINDPLQNAEDAAMGSIPGYAQLDASINAWNDTVDPPQSYFHDEWWQKLFVAAQGTVDIAGQILEAFALVKTIANTSTSNYLDAVGTAAGLVCKGQLTFLLNTVQPIQDTAGALLGNEAKIKNCAAMWKAVSENLAAAGEAIAPELDSTLMENWGGQAGISAAVRGSDLVNTVAFASESATGLFELLEIYGDMAKRINGMVIELIADVVASLIAAAGDIATKGGSPPSRSASTWGFC